jgi:hypothetical protein
MRSGLTLCPTKIVPSGSTGSVDLAGGAAGEAAPDGFGLAALPFFAGFGSAATATVASASADTAADFFFVDDLLARFAIAPHPF